MFYFFIFSERNTVETIKDLECFIHSTCIQCSGLLGEILNLILKFFKYSCLQVSLGIGFSAFYIDTKI